MLLSTPRFAPRRSLPAPLRLHLAGPSEQDDSDEHDANIANFSATEQAFTGNALPMEPTERHVTVGWRQEVSMNVLAVRGLIFLHL